jgi:hypothetical protein
MRYMSSRSLSRSHGRSRDTHRAEDPSSGLYALGMTERNEGATPHEGTDGDEVAYRRSAGVLSRRVGQEVIVASAEGDPYLLTGTGLAMWNLLRTPRTVSELVRELSTAYGAPPADVGSDVEPFLAELVSRGLVDEIGYGHA